MEAYRSYQLQFQDDEYRFDLDFQALIISKQLLFKPIFLPDNIDVNQDGNFAYTSSSAYIYIKKNAILRFHVVTLIKSCTRSLFRFGPLSSILDLGRKRSDRLFPRWKRKKKRMVVSWKKLRLRNNNTR